MRQVFAAVLIVLGSIAGAVSAQQGGGAAVWVQVEAQPSLRAAQERARYYSGRLADVNGFSLGGNWYGILLGPYSRDDAQRVLQIYRSEGQIPFDSFISQTSSLGQQFWPVGANVLNQGTVAAPLTEEAGTPATAAPTPEPQAADETPAEARRSERDLSAEQRKDLQIALQAAGFYRSGIDGAFGAGTRRSMADWQSARGYEATGVLTTMQRQALMDEYNAPLISVGMQRIQDPQAGIEMPIPTDVVKFSRYEPPFAHYDSVGDMGVRLILISQPGDQATLFGLYDIMQTLRIVPLEGPRERGRDSFTLEGRGNGIVSYTQAQLENGRIKGFTLVWPQGDEDRRARVLEEMKSGFTRTDTVLDPAAGADTEQNIDLVSGLQVRKPRLSRSGFFVDGRGTVVTAAEAVEGCARITLDHDHRAEIVATDDGLGVAVLRPLDPLAPIAVARLRAGPPRLQSEVAVSGYSYEGILGAPTLTFGKLEDVKGLRGEVELTRLALAPLPGDAGGPVIDAGGAVLGMLLPPARSARQLPGDVSFAADAQAIRNVLEAEGLSVGESQETAALPPVELGRQATGMTVLVSCWD
ncbi:MAG: trypsin-like peptidase domain-containing protein [Jhaorihella sp.]